MLEEAMNKWEDMPLKLLDGEKKMELTIGLPKTHGDLTGVIMDTSKSRWENANLIQLLFQDWLELTLSKLFLSDLISLLISFYNYIVLYLIICRDCYSWFHLLLLLLFWLTCLTPNHLI